MAAATLPCAGGFALAWWFDFKGFLCLHTNGERGSSVWLGEMLVVGWEGWRGRACCCAQPLARNEQHCEWGSGEGRSWQREMQSVKQQQRESSSVGRRGWGSCN